MNSFAMINGTAEFLQVGIAMPFIWLEIGSFSPFIPCIHKDKRRLILTSNPQQSPHIGTKFLRGTASNDSRARTHARCVVPAHERAWKIIAAVATPQDVLPDYVVGENECPI